MQRNCDNMSKFLFGFVLFVCWFLFWYQFFSFLLIRETWLECIHYQALTSGDRRETNDVHPLLCDKDLGPAWFRFLGDAVSLRFLRIHLVVLPLKPRTHLHSQPKGDKRNLHHGSFLKMIIIYAIVSRHVLLKHLRRRSFLNLGWSQNIRAYRLNITGMPSDLRQRSLIFPTLEKLHRPKVPPMMRTLSINRIKHHLPKPKVISFFLPLQRYMTKYHVALHAKEGRRVTT